MLFPVGPLEAERLRHLQSLNILDSAAQQEFDSVVALAQTLFDVPIVLISLIDEKRQWFKAKCGIDVCETDRQIAFCNHTILGREVLVVNDAQNDPRFQSNPLVTDWPGIRCYAGYPLSIEEGLNVGTLCLIGFAPREFAACEIEKLEKLGAVVEGLLLAYQKQQGAKWMAEEASVLAVDLQKRQSLLRQVENLAGIGAWSCSLSTGDLQWSDEVFRIHELTIGHMPVIAHALDFYPEPHRTLVQQALLKTFEEGAAFSFEADFVTAKGNKRRVRSTGDRIADPSGELFIVGIFQDITEQAAYDQHLWNLANLDRLTGLPNRERFVKVAEARLQEIGDNKLSLLLIDVDGFKKINDTFGHEFGDQLVKIIADRLRQVPNTKGELFRLGGDEFAMLISFNEQLRVARLCEKILKAAKRPISFSGKNISITCSIGCCTSVGDGWSVNDLFKSADIALRDVKRSARGTYEFFGERGESGLSIRQAAISRVLNAVAADRLLPFFQEEIDLLTGCRSGFEALVRIVDTDGRIVMPADFWPAFSDPDCALAISEQVLTKTLIQMNHWAKLGVDYGVIGINVSEVCIRERNYAEHVLSELNRYGVAPGSLMVEITETVILAEGEEVVLENIHALKKAGCKIALDDFGTGYASLSHLRDYPIDYVKIDRSFVKDLTVHSENRAIVTALVQLCRSLGIKVIAEGIEDTRTAEILRDINCDIGQGFLFGPAKNASEIDTGQTRTLSFG